MFRASHMFDDSAKSRNPGEIVLSGAAGESQQHFPNEAPNASGRDNVRCDIVKLNSIHCALKDVVCAG